MNPLPSPGHQGEPLSESCDAHLSPLSPTVFDDCLSLTVQLCRVPIAFVTLLTGDRQQPFAIVGVEGRDLGTALPFCEQVACEGHAVIVRDLAASVGHAQSLSYGAYAGVAIAMDCGRTIGTLSVLDQVSRDWTPEQVDGLHRLARQAAALYALYARRRVELVNSEVPEIVHAPCVGKGERMPCEGIGMQSLLQALNDGIEGLALLNQQGKFTYVNRAYAATYGYEVEELVGQPWQRLFGPVWIEELEQFYFPMLIERGRWRGELTGVTKGGREIHVELSLVVLKDGRDPDQWLLSTCRDVTSRHAMERLVLARQESLAQAQALAHLGSWEREIDSGEETWSDEQFRIFGYVPQSINPTMETFREAVHPDDRSQVMTTLERALADRTPFEQECRIVRPDGEVRVIQCRGALVLGMDGTPARMVGTVLDMTDAKRAASQLDEANHRLRLATESGGIGVWDLTIREGRLVWDERMLAHYGYSRLTFPSTYQAWMERLHPEDRPRVGRALATAAKGGPRFDTEFRVQLQGGAVRHLRAKALVLLNQSGTPERMIGVTYDVTQRTEAHQAQLAHQHLLSAISDAQSHVLASMPTVEVFKALLHNLLGLTQSAYGVIGEVQYGTDGAPMFHEHASADRVPDDHGPQSERLAPPTELGGLPEICRRLVETGEALTVNEPAADPRWAVREGGTGARAFAALPLKLGDRLVGVAVVANRPGGYSAAVVTYLQPYLQTCAAIVERVRAEEVFQRAHALQQSILGNAAHAVIATTTTGLVQHFNPAAEQLLGYEAWEVVGRVSSIVFHDQEEVAAHAARLSREAGAPVTPGFDVFVQNAHEHGPNQREWTFIRKDGSRVPVLLTVSALRDRTGQVSGYIGMAIDLTLQKQAEMARSEQETRLRAIVDQAVDGIITVDESGSIESFNPAAERLFGYALEDIIGKSLSTLIPELSFVEDEPEEVRNRLPNRPTFLGTGREVMGRRKDGDMFPAELTMSEMRFGDRSRFTGLVRDITERKEAEWKIEDVAHALECRNLELAQASDQAHQATRAKSEFLASMSHEIRTPMNAIIGMADLLQETALTDVQREYVDRFSRAASSLLDLINDILDFSKIEAGHLELEQVPFDLVDLIDKTGELVAVRAHAKRLELYAFVHPAVPTHIVGDPTRLRQVLINLLGNAVKFTERGDVTVAVEPARTDSGAEAIRFSVSDTGIGIPEEKLPAIFERFTQVDSSTTRRYGGTGLGLSICKRLVEMMGGNIQVESMVGMGTSFSFVIVPKVAPAEGAAGASLPLLPGRRLLIVSEHEINCRVVREYVTPAGAQLSDILTHAEALQALDDAARIGAPFDAVLVDFGLGSSAGVDLIDALRARPSGATVPVLVQTADIHNPYEDRLKALQVREYVYKPICRRRLLEALAQTLTPVVPAMTPVAAAPVATPRKALPARHLLLVEDLEDNRDVVRLFLAGTTYTMDVAENGAIACEKFREGRYDLVFMDMQMPIMDGYEAVESIRRWEQEQQRARTPIVALTANVIREEIDRSLTVGCDGHLTKPIKKKTLLAAIQQYTQGAGTEEAAA